MNFSQKSVVLLEAEAGSFADRESAVQQFAGARAVLITVKLGNKAGTVTVTPTLQRTLENGDVVTFWAAASALAANGTTQFLIGDLPGGTLSSSLTEGKAIHLPMEWTLLLDITSAGDGNEFDTYAEAEVFSY